MSTCDHRADLKESAQLDDERSSGGWYLVSGITDARPWARYSDTYAQVLHLPRFNRARPTNNKPNGETRGVVSSHCPNCGEALRLAAEAAARYANVIVQLVDLDLADSSTPEYVVAVPTYALDGRVISLGNPFPEELFTRLREAVG